MKKVTNYRDYVSFMVDWIQSRPRKGRGIKAQMAQFMGCNPIQITRVLNRSADLTLEQTAKMIIFLEINKLEGQYFFLLVELARAGNKELREFVEERINETIEKIHREGLDKSEKLELSREDFEIYFEHWYYLAIELLGSIPKFQTVDALTKRLNLPKSEVMNVLNFLVEKKLIEKKGDRYIRDLRATHFDTPATIYINKHHLNWRNRAINSLDQKGDEEKNMHTTVLFSLSKEDIPRLIKYFNEKAAEAVNSVNESPREELSCLCIDFFKVK